MSEIKKYSLSLLGALVLLMATADVHGQRAPMTSRPRVNNTFSSYDSYTAPARDDFITAARQGGSIAAFFNSPGVMGANPETSQYCQEGFESYLHMRAAGNQEDPISAWGGDGKMCKPREFANFICNRDFERFRRDRENYEHSKQVRATVIASVRPRGGVDPEGENYRAITIVYNPETDTCVCAQAANQCTGTPRNASQTVTNRAVPAFNSRGVAIDPDSASSEDCIDARNSFHALAQSRYTTPRFHRELQARVNQSQGMQNARRDLSALKQSLIATLRGKALQINAQGVATVGANCPPLAAANALPQQAGCLRGIATPIGPEDRIQNSVLARLEQNINDVEIVEPEGNACVGDDDNVMTVRRPGGGLRIYICPRALLGSNSRQPLQAALANALGHSLDSCAMEQMRVPDCTGAGCSTPLVSLARMGDGLRACLAENHLRTPRLPASSTSPSYVGVLGPEMSGMFSRSSAAPSEQERLAFLNNPTSGSHCTRSSLSNGNTTAVDNSGAGVQTNALEAQYWGTRALSNFLSAQTNAPATTAAARTARAQSAFGMKEDDRREWDNFCRNAYANARRDRDACLRQSSTPRLRNVYNLRNTYAPMCRDMRAGRTGVSTGNYPDSQVLFEIAGEDPQLQELMGCAPRTITPTVMQTDLFPPTRVVATPRRSSRARGPQPGHCNAIQFMRDGLAQVTSPTASPRGASPELAPATFTPRVASATASANDVETPAPTGGTEGARTDSGARSENPNPVAAPNPAPALATTATNGTANSPVTPVVAPPAAAQQGTGGTAQTPAPTPVAGTAAQGGNSNVRPSTPAPVQTETGSGNSPATITNTETTTPVVGTTGAAPNSNVGNTTPQTVRRVASPIRETPAVVVPQNGRRFTDDLRNQQRILVNDEVSLTCRGAPASQHCAEPSGITEDGHMLRYFEGSAASADGANCPRGEPCYCVAMLTDNHTYRCREGQPAISARSGIPSYQQVIPHNLVDPSTGATTPTYLIPAGSVRLTTGAGSPTGATGILYWPKECLDGSRTCSLRDTFVREPGAPRPAAFNNRVHANVEVANAGSEVRFQRSDEFCGQRNWREITHPPGVRNPNFFAVVSEPPRGSDGSGCLYNCSSEDERLNCQFIGNSEPAGTTNPDSQPATPVVTPISGTATPPPAAGAARAAVGAGTATTVQATTPPPARPPVVTPPPAPAPAATRPVVPAGSPPPPPGA